MRHRQDRAKNVVEEEFPEKGRYPHRDHSFQRYRARYHITSDKIAAKLGFTPKRTIEDAVRDLCQAPSRRASCPTA